ncbi:hypothetical protein NDU88_002372 [Pleurodeles waltl]|uniref:Uncharacterized protein n=1 Tax=Pleurodeles waltl TaxID=8319 RepID=A0AAV7TL16_PLEWA|nr:hypothetical protein NDU88_002372 [Pleurodeles waltl]
MEVQGVPLASSNAPSDCAAGPFVVESYPIQVEDRTAVRVLQLDSWRRAGSRPVLFVSSDIHSHAQARPGWSPIPGPLVSSRA